MKKKYLYPLLIMICSFGSPLIALAQDPDPDPTAPGDPIDPNDVPIDGGLTLLLAAGAAYGVKKYRNSRKKHAEEDNN